MGKFYDDLKESFEDILNYRKGKSLCAPRPSNCQNHLLNTPQRTLSKSEKRVIILRLFLL